MPICTHAAATGQRTRRLRVSARGGCGSAHAAAAGQPTWRLRVSPRHWPGRDREADQPTDMHGRSRRP
eukprot:1144549-Prymnesium_polylepis.1